MIVNFRARGISQGARKLTRTPTLIKKKKLTILEQVNSIYPILNVKIFYHYKMSSFFSLFFLKKNIADILLDAIHK
jgi:hypothetical protein